MVDIFDGNDCFGARSFCGEFHKTGVHTFAARIECAHSHGIGFVVCCSIGCELAFYDFQAAAVEPANGCVVGNNAFRDSRAGTCVAVNMTKMTGSKTMRLFVV